MMKRRRKRYGHGLSKVPPIYIPFAPEIFGVQGLIRVISKIRDFQKELGVSVRIGGVIGMMIDPRTNLHKGLMLQADAYCKKHQIKLLKTRIPKTIRYSDAIARFGMPEVWADPNSPFSKYYFELLKEVEEDWQERKS